MGNVTMMDSFRIIEACDLEVGRYSKPNELMNVYDVPLTMAKHHSNIEIITCCTK